MSFGEAYWGFLLIPTASLFIVGLLAIRSGRLRRVGNSPHCRRCDYVLTGNQSAVCPECGQDLVAGNIILGDRFRPRSFWVGVVVALVNLLLMLAIVSPVAYRYDWYRWRLVSWVIEDAKSRNYAQASRAFDELSRRRTVGRLNDADERQLTAYGLSEQALAQTPGKATTSILPRLLDYLGQRALDGKLTEQEKKQFFENAIHFRIRVRPEILAGDLYSMEISSIDCGPSSGLWLELPKQTLLIDRHVEWEEEAGARNAFAFGTTTQTQEALMAGDHPVALQSKFRARSGPPDDPKSKVIYEWTDTTRSGLYVVERLSNDLKLLDKPELRSTIAEAISASSIIPQRHSLGLTFSVRPLPENIAFEIFVKDNGKEYRLSEMALPKGQQMNFHMGGQMFETPLSGDKVDIILRSSEKVGRKTVNLFDIWKGEIVLKDVPVKRSQK